MRWFKHITSASDDNVLAAALDKFGPAAYAVWWITLEKIAQQMDQSSHTFAQYSSKRWANFCRISKSSHIAISKYFHDRGKWVMKIEGHDITIDCKNLLKFRDEYTKKKIQLEAKMSGQAPDNVRTSSGQTPDGVLTQQSRTEQNRTETEKNKTKQTKPLEENSTSLPLNSTPPNPSMQQTDQNKVNGNDISFSSQPPHTKTPEEDLIDRLIEYTNSPGSRAFYQGMITKLGRHKVGMALAETRAKDREGNVNDPAKYLTATLKNYAKEFETVPRNGN